MLLCHYLFMVTYLFALTNNLKVITLDLHMNVNDTLQLRCLSISYSFKLNNSYQRKYLVGSDTNNANM